MFFYKNLKYLRNKNNLSQTELAKILNYSSRDAIKALESGIQKPSFEKLIEIRNFFKISLDDLVFKDLSESKQ